MSSAVSVPLDVVRRSVAPVWCPFHVTVAALIVVFTYFFCGHSVADPDIWWHLKDAQILVQQHHWLRADQFSYTVKGTPWVNSEWLAELAYYGAWCAGGLKGLFLLYSIVAEAIMVGTLLLCWRASGNIKAAFLPSVIAVMMSVVNFGPRTILFGWACFLGMMFVLWKMMNSGRAPLWTLPLIFLAWVNLHGSWLIGLIVFAIVIVGGLFEGTWEKVYARKWTRAQLRRLLTAFATTIAILFVNPYGYRVVFYPFDLAYRQKLNVAHVQEWMSIDFHETRGKIVFGLLLMIVLLALAARRKWSVTEVALVCFGLYISLTYVRFLFPAAILIAPILSRQLDFMPQYQQEIDRSWLNAALTIALMVFVVRHTPTTKILREDLAKKMPDGGIHYLLAHARSSDRVYNHYFYGGYLIWNAPSIPTAIDSRTDIFEYKGVFKDYLDIIKLKDSLNILDRYHPDYILFPKEDPVTYMLRQSSRWHLVYEDGVSCVFARPRAHA